MVGRGPRSNAGAPRGLSALDRKLLRDLWAIRGQAIAIALVIAAGISVFVALLSTFDSLDLSLRTYYDRYRFGDVFASLVRAPLALVPKVEAIPGVAKVESRVVVDVDVDVKGMGDPAAGRLVSIPADRRPALCDLFLREGRYIEPGRPDEVLAGEAFARAHGLKPGDSIGAVINGRRRELRIVGLALSPEYIYVVRHGELLPDESRFGVFWMERRALASAFQMDGAFNNLVLKLMQSASERDVTARLDALLEPSYGGTGAVPRSLQPSNWFLENKLKNLKAAGRAVPMVFLGVAAFLLNVVLSRIVLVQRPQIAAVKALGYSNAAIAAHYVKWSLAVALLGSALGVAGGAWLGSALTRLYAQFFHFPVLIYRLNVPVTVAAVAIGVLAALAGAIGAVRRAVRLPPAEAMRPDVPMRFSESWIERVGLRRLLSQPSRIVVRTLQRHSERVLLSVIGIGLGTSLLVLGQYTGDAVNTLTDTVFNVAQRYDTLVTFVEPTSASALDDLRRLPGVIDVEPMRAAAVRLSNDQRTRTLAISGLQHGARMNRVIDGTGTIVTLPGDGLVLSAKLAQLLGTRAGDRVRVELLEGRKSTRDVTVKAVISDFMGINCYMDLDALHRLLEEGPTLSGAYLQIDRTRERDLFRQLKITPRVAGVLPRRAAIDSLRTTMTDTLLKVQAIYALFASIIAFGVVYNNARISLSERSRELATLRVIGFTRPEISFILLGELALVTVVAVPLGLLFGHGLAASMVRMAETEMFRLPLVIAQRSYAISALVIIVATAASALVVRRRLDRLNLVEVLKSRE
jgi:putative ABC transport system permease protein